VLESLGDKTLAPEAYLTAIFLLDNRRMKQEEDERRNRRKVQRRNSLNGQASSPTTSISPTTSTKPITEMSPLKDILGVSPIQAELSQDDGSIITNE